MSHDAIANATTSSASAPAAAIAEPEANGGIDDGIDDEAPMLTDEEAEAFMWKCGLDPADLQTAGDDFVYTDDYVEYMGWTL